MANWALIGFASAAISAVVLADYADQSRMAGLPVGEIGVVDYFGQFGLPNAAHRAEMSPPTQISVSDPRAFLPDAPSGWTRRHWTEGDNTWLHKDRKQAEKQEANGKNTIFNRAMTRALSHRRVYAQRRAFSAGWIYERGSDIVFIGADVLEKQNRNSLFQRGIAGIDRALNRQSFREGFGVVHGVPYVESKHVSESKRLFRSFQGRIGYGQEIRIRVRSHSSENALRDFMAKIDHVGLNQLLDVPVTGIGPGTLELSPYAGEMLAGYAYDIRDTLEGMSKRTAREVLRHGPPMYVAIAQVANGSALPEVLSSTKQQDRVQLAAYAAEPRAR